MKTFFSLIFFTCSLTQVTAQQNEFSWLVGHWELQHKNKVVFEDWSVAADQQTLHGISYQVNGPDTVVTEKIKIVWQGDSYYYVPDVAGDQDAVLFKIVNHDVKSFTAENLEHDFPTLIRYHFSRRENSDWLLATIEGHGKKISYTFVRVDLR